MSLLFEEIPRLISCQIVPSTLKGILGPLSIDSRRLNPGDVFIALKTDQADGHDFIAKAFSQGASAALVNKEWFDINRKSHPGSSFIVADDTLEALQKLAKSHRKRFHIPVIALTGSNGKTATKELLATALKTQLKVLKSPGNYNNDIGIPLTLLQIDPATEIVLLELGTNQPGDLALLCAIAKPEYGLVLNVGPAHLQGFGDLDGVAKEKAELLRFLPPAGAAFVNSDDSYVNQMETSANQRFCYGFDVDAPGENCLRMICAENLGLDEAGFGSFRLRGETINMNWYGIHQIYNGLAATTVANYFGIPLEDIAEKFASMPPLEGRLKVDLISGITLIDDAYNANTTSTMQALNFLKTVDIPGKKYVVLGDHLELGDASAEEHLKLGAMLAEQGVDGVFLVGKEMRHALPAVKERLILHQENHEDVNPVSQEIKKILGVGDAILIKGSRGMGLDRVVKDIYQFCKEVKG